MSMDDQLKAKYEEKSAELRAELKKWEGEWTAEHGSKPSRDAIKANPEIARRYKDYNRVRDILSGKVPPPARHDASKKRNASELPAATPVKKSKHAETPMRDRTQNEELIGTPAISRKLFSPAPVTALGPTPQRDGKVLGLFDLLVERELGTPKSETPGKVKKAVREGVASTPSKRHTADPESTPRRLGRTPMSSSKRHMLNTFMTPLKNRDYSAQGQQTPSAVSKLQFDTPSFLKRHSMPAVEEDSEFDAPAPLRLPRKPMVRGLSEIVASLRKVEEEAFDDEMDALRDIEAEETGEPASARPPPGFKSKHADSIPDELLAPDSQAQSLLLGGFDDETQRDGPAEEQLDRDGQPLRIYKKKGQKRTTRKVNSKPVWKAKPSAIQNDQDDRDGNEPDSDYEAEVRASDAESDDEYQAPAAKTSANEQKKETGGAMKKAARKVNELAHANFQKLKLKNTGSKGGPGIEAPIRIRRAIHANDALLLKRILLSHPSLLHNPDATSTGLSNSNLHLAASLGHRDVCHVLLEAGHEEPDPALNEHHQTALMLAAAAGHTDVVHLLCENKPEIIMRGDMMGRDALMEASRGGYDTIVQILLTYVPCGVYEAVQRADEEGNTALHYASGNGNLLVLRTLLAAGANAQRRNIWDWTPAAYSATDQAAKYLEALATQVGRRQQQASKPSVEPPKGMSSSVRMVASHSDDNN